MDTVTYALLNAHMADNVTAHTPETPIAPTLINSWVNFGAGYATAGYWKDAMGIVHLKGSVKNGTVPATIFILPTGYRPAEIIGFNVSTGQSGSAYIWISIFGEVFIQSGDNAIVYLDGISFRAGV